MAGATESSLWLAGDRVLAVLENGASGTVRDLSGGMEESLSYVRAMVWNEPALLLLTTQGMLSFEPAHKRIETLVPWKYGPSDRQFTLATRLVGSQGRAILYEYDGQGTNNFTYGRVITGTKVGPRKRMPEVVTAVAADRDGSILAGTVARRVLRFTPQLDTSTVIQGGSSLRNFIGACPLYDGVVIVNGDNGLFSGSLDRSEGISFLAAPQMAPWKSCAPLSATDAIILAPAQSVSGGSIQPGDHNSAEDEVTPPASLLSIDAKGHRATITPLACRDEHCPTSFEYVAFNGDLPGKAWLLGTNRIWTFSTEDRLLRPLVSLPDNVEGVTTLAVDREGLWIGTTRFGVWRWPGDPTGTSSTVNWQGYDEINGLPSADAGWWIGSMSATNAALITSRGLCRATKTSNGWTFQTRPQSGVAGSQTGAAALIETG